MSPIPAVGRGNPRKTFYCRACKRHFPAPNLHLRRPAGSDDRWQGEFCKACATAEGFEGKGVGMDVIPGNEPPRVA